MGTKGGIVVDIIQSMKIKFAPGDKIDRVAHRLIKDVYGIEGAFLTNLSSLYDFEDLLDEIPGYKRIKFTDVPKAERKLYKKEDLSKPERLLVWYPPLSKKDEHELWEAYRRSIIKRLESFYGISFKEYPNDELYVWEVVKFIREKLLIQ